MSNKMILSACATSKDNFALLCMDEDREGEREIRTIIQGQLSGSVVRQDDLVRISSSPRTPGVFSVLSAYGTVEFFSDSAVSIATEQIIGDNDRLKGVPTLGFLNSISYIGDILYACGIEGKFI